MTGSLLPRRDLSWFAGDAALLATSLQTAQGRAGDGTVQILMPDRVHSASRVRKCIVAVIAILDISQVAPSLYDSLARFVNRRTPSVL